MPHSLLPNVLNFKSISGFCLLLLTSTVAFSQQAPNTSATIHLSQEDKERGLNGIQKNFYFTTSSISDYQSAGFFGQRLRPYFSGDQNAISFLNDYRRQKWIFLGERAVFVSSVLVYAQQSLSGDKQQYFNKTQKAAIGVAAASLLANVFITRNTNQHFQRAVEAHNSSLPAARQTGFERFVPSGVGVVAGASGQPQLALRWSLR